MRLIRLFSQLLAIGLFAALSQQTTSGETNKQVTPDNLLFRARFVGTRSLLANTNATYLTNLAVLPETAALGTRLITQAASLAGRFPGISSTNGKAEQLQPLFGELLKSGFTLELRGTTTEITDFALAAKETGQLSAHWDKAWRETGKGALTVQRAGGWLFAVGSKTATAPALAEIIKTLASPEPASNSMLEVEFTSSLIPEPVKRSVYGGCSQVKLSVTPADQSLKIRGTVSYPSDLPRLGPPPIIPTNLFADPVTSFTVVRNPSSWLAAGNPLRKLLPKPIPNELYFWGTVEAPFSFFAAMPSPRVDKNADRLTALAEEWQKVIPLTDTGKIEVDPTQKKAVWNGVPFVMPQLTEATQGSQGYLVAGLAPWQPSTNPLPAALVERVSSRTNLVLYDWELTSPRLTGWLYISQLGLMLTRHKQLGDTTPSLRWILESQKALPHGGNTVTEITQTGPRELSLNRRAPLAFNSTELFWLANWLESANFPKANFLMPVGE